MTSGLNEMIGRVPAGSGRSLFSDPLAVEVADADAVLLAAEPLAVAVPEAETEAETELSTSLPLAETLAVAEALPLSESVEVEIASMLKLAVSVTVLLSDVTVLEGSDRNGTKSSSPRSDATGRRE